MFASKVVVQPCLIRCFSRSFSSFLPRNLRNSVSALSFSEASTHHLSFFPTFSPIRSLASEASVEEVSEENLELKPKMGDAIVAATEKNPKDRRTVQHWRISAEYMRSQAYRHTYGTEPVWKPYRRQHKGQIPRKFTRKTCIRHGMIVTGSPCPLCRDEYLTLDYRHTDLLKQFISPYTGEILNWRETNICMRKYHRLTVELMKARYFGTMEFKTPFRHYDYSEFYNQELGSGVETALRASQLDS